MAQLVSITGLTHNPYLPGLMKTSNDDAVQAGIRDYNALHERLVKASPDVLLVVASDHLNQWFTDNMAPFTIGKAPRAKGPFPHEQHVFGLDPYETKVDVDVARQLLRSAPYFGVDFAFSDEFLVDHSFTVPLNFVRPEMDLPIVPIWTNVISPPVPPSQRFYAVGEALRNMIDELPKDLRVGVVSSGHLAVEVGGPKIMNYSADDTFDKRMMELIDAGDAKTVVAEATWERLMQAGNVTPGFLNYVLLMGIARGKAPAATALHFSRVTAAVNYMVWDGSAAA